MKITELRCPACNGTMKIDEKNPNLAVCEYCGTKYLLEWEGNDAWISSAPTVPPTPKPGYAAPAPKKPEKKNSVNFAAAAAVCCIILAGVVLMQLPALTGKNSGSVSGKAETNRISETKSQSGADGQEIPEEGRVALKGALKDVAEKIFEKPQEQITEKELSEIRWIGSRYWDGGSTLQVGYCREDPFENPDAELTWMSFNRSETDLDLGCLGAFPELTKLSLSMSLYGKQLEGLKLKGISCYADSPAELAALLEHPEEIIELEFPAGLDSLEGLSGFPNVETLWIDGYSLTDLTELAVLNKKLKSLTLENCDDVTDFSVLFVMEELTSLTVESEGLKSMGFLAKLPKLSSLRLADTGLLALTGLGERADTLESLEIEDCGNLKDCSEISGLTGLKHLFIEVPYNCTAPDLSSLTGLEELTLGGFNSVSFLRSMPNLRKLSLSTTAVDDVSVFGSLTGLEELKCTSYSGSLDKLDFIAGLPALKKLDLTGAATYYDISAIFNMPTLETLLLNGVECEINFDRLQDNPSLKTLEMDGVKLYKNVKVDGGGGILYVDWDDVTLNEYTSFLSHYPNLEILSIADNELTQVDFAAGLGNLKEFDMSDNYVTDIKPLASAVSLQTLNITGNPVENTRVLGEKVRIIQ